MATPRYPCSNRPVSPDSTYRPTLPVISLTALGVMITVIGLFAAGNIVIAALGLGAIFAAGLIGVAERLIDARITALRQPVRDQEEA